VKTETIILPEFCPGGMSTREEGRDLLVLILQLWKRVDSITLDFMNELVASTSFIDEVFGTLALHFSNEELKAKLKLENLDPIDRRMINATIAGRRKELANLISQDAHDS
jgi:hypothetical protein